MLRALLGSFACLAAVQTATADEPTTWTPDPTTRIVQWDAHGQWKSIRVGGDMDAAVIQRGIIYTIGPCRIDTELPELYPIPTAPDALEIKRYPQIRRAEYTTPMDDANASRRVGNRGFWPLFRHIEARSIPMTSPVEMDYHGMTLDDLDGLHAWTMSFLYRTAEEGIIETDGHVQVVNTRPVTMLSSGVRGVFNGQMLEEQIGVLRTWLDGQDDWRASGDVRVFQYNGPMTRPGNRWVEVQVPIEQMKVSSGDVGDESKRDHAPQTNNADDGAHSDGTP